MSSAAKAARTAMKSKAERLANQKNEKVDASSWSPSQTFEQEQVGKTPKPRAYRRGGKVEGEKAKRHAGSKPRKGKMDGGAMGMMPQDPRALAAARINMADTRANVPTRVLSPTSSKGNGAAPTMPYKKGGFIKAAIKHPGALHKALGVPKGEKIPDKKIEKAEHSDNPKLARRAHLAETLKGLHKGRAERKAGGRAKGKTNITINIVQPQKDPMAGMPPMGADAGPVPPPGMGGAGPAGVPVPMPPPAMPPGMPPGMPPMGGQNMLPPSMAGGPGPMKPMRKAGGRIHTAGSRSGEGRLEKIASEKEFLKSH